MPDWRAYVRSRLPSLGVGPIREADIVEELAQQIEECYMAALGRGASEEEARRAASAEITDWSALAREIEASERAAIPEPQAGAPEPEPERTRLVWRLVSDFMLDVRHGVRGLRKTPGFTFLSVLTLALGIGATTAIFSVVSAVLLRPLPFHRPQELVRLWTSWAQYPFGSVSEPELHDWRERGSTLAGVAAYACSQCGASLSTGAGDPQTVTVATVSANFFEVLGVGPALGRAFLPGENDRGKTNVAVLSRGLWLRLFGADPGIVGRTVTLHGETVTIVGVMPADLAYPTAETGLWQPIVLDRKEPRPRGNHYLRVVARIKPGLELTQVRAEMEVVARQLQAEYTANYPSSSGFGIRLQPLREELLGPVEPPLFALLGAVALVLLIACANVANLALARGMGRTREIAVRSALGASRKRLARQMLAESLLLAVLGGAVGALAARWALPALLSLAPAGMPRLHEVRVDGAVLAFAAALTALTGLAFGLFPVWQSAHVDSSQILRSGRAGANAASRRPQKLLVVAEMTLAVVLLVGAGLLLRSFAKLLGEEPGFDPDGVATALVALPSARYSTPEAVGQFFERLRRSLEESPGITSAAMCNNPPLSGWRNDDLLTIEGYTPPGDQPPDEESRAVSPGYFRTLRIAVLRGREFDEKDDAQHPPVAIVSQSMASKYWGNQDPVGRRMGLVDDRGALQRWMTIVGVVGDVKQTSLADPVVPTFYRPHVQATWNSMMVVVRSAGGDSRLPLAAIRSRLRELDREQALFEARPMNDIVDESLSAQQFNLRLLGLFAVLAVALAGTGIYGVMRYIVGQRTSEIGLRMALGATQRQVLAQVLREGLTLAAVGLALGLGASVLLTRTMEALSGLLYGVTATDPLTLAAVIAMLAAVAVLACWAPARKATGVDPIVALREE